MKIIPVKIPNRFASKACFVDDEDFSILKDRKWSLSNGYPRTGFTNRILNPKKRQIFTRMHKCILWSPKGTDIDHMDGNKLNNQKVNLRICSRSENSWNRKKHKNNHSGFKGVSWIKRQQQWDAKICKHGETKFLGYFDSPAEASEVYKKAAKKLFAAYAKLN